MALLRMFSIIPRKIQCGERFEPWKKEMRQQSRATLKEKKIRVNSNNGLNQVDFHSPGGQVQGNLHSLMCTKWCCKKVLVCSLQGDVQHFIYSWQQQATHIHTVLPSSTFPLHNNSALSVMYLTGNYTRTAFNYVWKIEHLILTLLEQYHRVLREENLW